MSFGLFLNKINNEDRKLFQKLISLCKKRIKLERSKKYLEICIENNLYTILYKDCPKSVTLACKGVNIIKILSLIVF